MMDRLVYEEDENGGTSEAPRHERRSQPQIWQLRNGALLKLAGSVAAAMLIGGFLLKALGWTLVGTSTTNTAEIDKNRAAIATNTTSIAALNASVAALNTLNAGQARDIIDLKAAMVSSLFMQCAMYTKMYVGAPTISECVRSNSNP